MHVRDLRIHREIRYSHDIQSHTSHLHIPDSTYGRLAWRNFCLNKLAAATHADQPILYTLVTTNIRLNTRTEFQFSTNIINTGAYNHNFRKLLFNFIILLAHLVKLYEIINWNYEQFKIVLAHACSIAVYDQMWAYAYTDVELLNGKLVRLKKVKRRAWFRPMCGIL